MSITSDNFMLYIALVCAAASMLGYAARAVGGRRGSSTSAGVPGVLFYVCCASTACVCIYFMQQILSQRRYDIAYIFYNTGPGDSLVYRVSSFWAGQEGSLLLWTFLAALVGLALVRKLSFRAPAALAFWCSFQFFLLLLLVVDDPFAKLTGFQPGMVGVGLNPLLKNPWMAVHPPVIFIGYALLVVPAALAVNGLIRGDAGRWSVDALPWALAGWGALGAGIALGMVWSYEVLGWGGYWGWDPVENASLVPWLTGTALVHGLVLQRVRGRMIHTNLLLALGTFLLILYATFLTRSGVLSKVSVHSFAETGTFGWMRGFLVFYAVLCVGLLTARWRAVSVDVEPVVRGSRDFVLTLGVVVLVLFAVVVLLGTSYPLVADAAVQPGFYNRVSIPLGIASAVLMILAPLVKWGGRQSRRERSPAVFMAFLALLVLAGVDLAVGIAYIAAPRRAEAFFTWLVSSGASTPRLAAQVLILLASSAVLALVVNAAACVRTRPARAGAYLAHIGASFMILGIIFSSAGSSTTLALSVGGEPQRAFGFEFTYDGRRMAGSSRELLQVTARKGAEEFSMPLVVESTHSGQVRSPGIKSWPFLDLYVSPVDVKQTTVTPTFSMTENGPFSVPAQIPGTNADVRLTGLQVEARSARIELRAKGREPVEIVVAEDTPAEADGYTFEFLDFVVLSPRDEFLQTAGVRLGVTGPGLQEQAIIEVSTRPLISLLWVGLALVLIGCVLALTRRIAENRRRTHETDREC